MVLATPSEMTSSCPVSGQGETVTAAPMYQNYTLASWPFPGEWAVLSRGTFSGSILMTSV